MLKNVLMASALIITLMVAVSCGKKDEGGPGPVGCEPGRVMSPMYGKCMDRQNCPVGLVADERNRADCISPYTGERMASQICGSGQVLTREGCFTQGVCKQWGQALVGDRCMDIVQPSINSNYNPNFGNGYGTGGYGNGGYNNGGYYGGGYNGGYGGYNNYNGGYYRPF